MQSTCNPIPDFVWAYLAPLIGKRMIELGRKKTLRRKIKDAPPGGDWVTYKSYFENVHDYDHVSIDIQGGYGSLPYDLTEHIGLEPADMVTNIATTEHVSQQNPCWRNVHEFCRPGGVIVSSCPLPGDWWWHGMWYPTERFYEQFAERNGYKIEYMEIGRVAPHRNIDVRLFKVDDLPFMMPDEDTLYRNKIRPR